MKTTDDPNQLYLVDWIDCRKGRTTVSDLVGCGTPETLTRGPYQQIYSGKPFYLLDPRPEDVDINDIAQSLGKLCRYIGHCRGFYSVAQHCIMVSHLVDSKYVLWALLHDAGEAYTGDISKPMKVALEERAPGALKQIAENIDRAIAARFGIPWDHVMEAHAEVKRADVLALATERHWLMADTGETEWGPLPEPLPLVDLTGAYHVAATARYLRRFNEIVG